MIIVLFAVFRVYQVQKNLSNLTLNGTLKKCRIRRLSDYRVTLVYFNVVTVPHKMVGLERMSDYRSSTVQQIS